MCRMLCNRNNPPGNFEVIRIRRNHPGGETMNICKRTIIMAAGAAVAALAVGAPASASTATQSVRSFYFSRQGDDDRPHPGLWQRRRLGHRHGAAHRHRQRRGTGAAVPLRPRRHPVLRLLRCRKGHRLVPRVPVRPDAEPVHSGPAHQERRHRPGGRVLLVRVLRQHRAQCVHRAPVLLGPFFAVAGWPKLFFPFGTRFSPC